MPSIAALDWIILGVALLSTWIGMVRGLVYELLMLLGWLAAFVLAYLYGGVLANMLPMDALTPALRQAAGFALTFIVCAFAAGFIASLAKKLIASVGLRPVDRVLGGFFGLLRGVLILLAISTVIRLTPLKDASWWVSSRGVDFLIHVLESVKPFLAQGMAARAFADAIRQMGV